MLDVIEKLLILQDRDRNILRTRTELSHVGPEREMLQGKVSRAQTELDKVRQRLKQIESDRKRLELEVDSKKQLIEKYSIQQFQTRKNDEYKALAHEIETCKGGIVKLEDEQLGLMEQAEGVQKELAVAVKIYDEAKRLEDQQLKDLGAREENLKKELESLESDRSTLAMAVEEGTRARYERLFGRRGEKVIVGIQHGVCGGCHMKLPPQVLLSCQAGQELVSCTNCGRLLYYTRDMDLMVVD